MERVLLFEGLPRRIGWTSFALNFYFGGLKPFGYHLVNVLLHAFNGFILFLVCRRLLGLPHIRHRMRTPPELVSLLGAGLWLVHPVQTQAVSYVYQRFTCLSAAFLLLAVYFYLEARTRQSRWRMVFYAASLLSGLLALGTKENTATLPAVILLTEWLISKSPSRTSRRRWLLWGVAVLAFLLLVSFYFLGPNAVEMIRNQYQSRGFTLGERLLTEARIVVYYISLLIFPHPSRLRLDYDFSVSTGVFSPPTTFLSILFIAGLWILALARAKKHPFLSFSILWFFGNLVIESTIVPLDLIYEHRLYVASMAPLAAFAGFVVHQWPRWAPRPVSSAAVLTAASVLFGYWTFERNRIWGSAVVLWEDNVVKSPNKPRTHFQLARAYMAQQAWDDAEEHLETAIQLDPDYHDAYTTLANIYIEQQVQPERSEELLMRVLAENPDDVFALVGMGVLHSRRGDVEAAMEAFHHVLELEPGNLAALVNSAAVHFEQEDYEEAARVARIGTGYWPANAQLAALLGAALAELGQKESAEVVLERALELDPGNPLASRYLDRR